MPLSEVTDTARRGADAVRDGASTISNDSVSPLIATFQWKEISILDRGDGEIK
eukprot:m.219198 g.219198  ORF g.219198 m.219198 type:complete len:53 (-) comp13821_c5_seq1:520-678(-)